MEQKYQHGQRVRCINYGHAIYKFIGNGMAERNDLMPELVGEEGTIKGSYKDLHGGSQERNLNSYSVKWDVSGEISWFGIEQLEAI
jgi:hypothetical protein